MKQTKNATISVITIVEPTGVLYNIETIIPINAHTTEIIIENIKDN